MVNERCNRLAHGLAGLGLNKPDVVGFLCNNRVELAEVYFALAKLGLVGIPLNYRLAPAEIVALMKAMGARAMLFETRFASAADQVRPALDHVETFIAIGDGRPNWALDYETLLAGAPSSEPEVEIEEHDLYYFNLTSGTTGLPKSYALTHFNNSSVSPMFNAFDMTSHDVIMTVFPAFGRVGFAWIAAGLLFGARNVLMDFNPAEALRLIETERVTIINLVPTMGAMMLAEPSLPDRDLKSLRALVFVGAMFPAPLRERVASTLCPEIYEYYGMQETGTLTMSTPRDRIEQPELIGLRLGFSDIRIVRADGSVAARRRDRRDRRAVACDCHRLLRQPAKVGRDFSRRLGSHRRPRHDERGGLLLHQGAAQGHDHHGRPERPCRRSRGGDPRDYGRRGLRGVRPSRRPLGERIVALIVKAPSGGEALTEESVRAACRGQLAGFKTPKSILFQEEPLPRTPTGKVQKFLLVERFSSRSYK